MGMTSRRPQKSASERTDASGTFRRGTPPPIAGRTLPLPLLLLLFVPGVLLALLTWSPGASAQDAPTEPTRFRLVGSRIAPPTTPQEVLRVLAYVELLDENERPVKGVSPDSAACTLGATVLDNPRFTPLAAEEGTAVVFLVDVSKSLKQNEFSRIRDALAAWADSLGEADRGAVMLFGERVRLVQDFTADKAALAAAIKELALTDNRTELHAGIAEGLRLAARGDEALPPRRVVVVVSDGIEDAPGGTSRDEVLASLREHPIPVYAVGFALPPLTNAKRDGLAVLGEFARTSGGALTTVEKPDAFQGAFETLRERINSVYLLAADAGAIVPDGKTHRLQVTLRVGSRTFTDGTDLRVLPLPGLLAAGASPDLEAAAITAPESTTAVTGAPKTASPSPQAAETPAPSPGRNLPLLALGAGVALLVLMALFRNGKRTPLEKETPPAPEEPAAERTGAAPRIVAGEGFFLRLTVLKGADVSRHYDAVVTDRLSLGRSSKGNGMVLKGDMGISGTHCEFFLEKGRLFVRDLGSTNGTYVNGVAIVGPCPLSDQDRLLLGSTELRVHLPASASREDRKS